MNLYCWHQHDRFKYGTMDAKGKLVLLGTLSYEWAGRIFEPNIIEAVKSSSYKSPIHVHATLVAYQPREPSN